MIKALNILESLMMEYDADHMNTGIKFFWFDRLQILVGLRDKTDWEANITYHIMLN